MSRSSRIFLVGPMGAGKSTIGRQLAEALGLEFADTDVEIQRRTGVDIPTIFEYEGEEGFRARERQVVDDMTQLDNLVLATGGGVIMDPDNRRNLSARGLVVYLYCTPEQQYERTYRDRNRPLLQTADPKARLEQLMAVRDPLYRETADLEVSTERRSATAVTRDIIRHMDED
jgi:shikimate kinase